MSPQRSFGAPVRGEHDGESPHSHAVVLAASPRAVTDDWGTFVRLVVVGADGSVGSRSALSWAARLCAATGAEVLAVHVLTYNHEFARDLSIDTMRTWRRDLRHDLETRWIEPLTAAGARHRCLLVEDDSAASGLLKTCEDEHADLIVVGARSHHGLGDSILGGVSSRVTHAARVPVVVVPPEWSRSSSDVDLKRERE